MAATHRNFILLFHYTPYPISLAMPVEVISLLSSSPQPEPTAAQRLPIVRSNASRLDPSEAFDISDDPASQIPQIELTRQKSRPSVPPAHLCSRAGASNDYLFVSDDFDTTGDLDGDSDDWLDLGIPDRPKSVNGTKRSPLKALSRSGSTINHANVLRPRQIPVLKRREAVEDAKQPTGSPDAPVVRKCKRQKTYDDDDDPFASSPINGQTSVPDPQSLRLVPLDDDPFVSPLPKLRAKANAETVTWDPISSSAPPESPRPDPFGSQSTLRQPHSEVIELDSEDEDVPANLFASSENEFPDIANARLAKISNKSKAPTKAKKTRITSDTTRKSAEERAREREEKAAAREAERERKRREKEQARERRALEKESARALAEANKLRVDKKVSTPEMIVDVSSSISGTLKLQVEKLLDDLDVQHETWLSPVDNVIKWRRKVSAIYNSDSGHWEPIPTHIEKEHHVLVLITAAEFVNLVQGEEAADLEAHVLSTQRCFHDHTIIYMIEGLSVWMRQNRNVRNRQFVSAVRSRLDADVDTGPSTVPAISRQQQAPHRAGRTNRQPPEHIDEDAIEDALLDLQVLHGALIHHTSCAAETAQWITAFTQHISTIPYRRQRERENDESAAFCMDTGQVRTGEGAADTYVRMLQEVARVTAPVAHGVAAEFESVTKLVRGLETQGPLALEGVRKSANHDGAFSDRRVGQAVSRRIYKVFTGRDEMSTDI